jgi:CheY-like chemotaxis protein
MNLASHLSPFIQKFNTTGFQPGVENTDIDQHPDQESGKTEARPDPDELRILLIEDSRPIQERLAEMLSVPGLMHIAGSAATEKEALEQIDAAEFDVLLVDVELRQGSGIGAIRHARDHYPESRQPLIIVLTNYPLPAVRRHCFDAGADHFLDKMHQFQDVRALISDAPHLCRD